MLLHSNIYSRGIPFRTVSQLDDRHIEQFSNQTVILLTDLLDVAQKYNKNVMFDIKFECKDHPFENDYGENHCSDN